MTKVSLVIQSQLNDAIVEMEIMPIQAEERLRFVKWMIHMFPDTNVRVDVDVVYKQFKLKEQVSLEN
jgi:hypothetical protein